MLEQPAEGQRGGADAGLQPVIADVPAPGILAAECDVDVPGQRRQTSQEL
jgi:hypothetical protein